MDCVRVVVSCYCYESEILFLHYTEVSTPRASLVWFHRNRGRCPNLNARLIRKRKRS